MFLHLPIAMMAMLSPIAVSDKVPVLDVVKECRFEGAGSSRAFDLCSKDEIDARRQLQEEWAQFVAADKNTCLTETTIDGFASYVELLTCLEIENDLRHDRIKSQAPLASEGPQPVEQRRPDTALGDAATAASEHGQVQSDGRTLAGGPLRNGNGPGGIAPQSDLPARSEAARQPIAGQ